ncbi:MAG: extracellular solute-binding protein, partial [Lawsonibacter sp.]|nr:extracellular solute-binding protein [Lawsonibacter sp.]
MKKLLSMLLASAMVLSLAACGGGGGGKSAASTPASSTPASSTPASSTPSDDPMAELIEAAQAEGELVVYGSCEEDYLAAACQKFQELYGIKTTFQRLSTGEVQAKIEEENGNPSADVWFGGTTDPYNVVAAEGLLEPYEAMNASHITKDVYKHSDNMWYGIYTGILGFMVNKDRLDSKGLEAPKDWPDLLKPEYEGLIWLSNYNTAGTAKLVINTMIQKYG